RHPKTFAGLRDDDVEDWLDGYERVSLYNKWDNQAKLRNAIFYLADVAKIWFTNHEDEIATWPDFKTHLVEIFGKPSDRKASAERKLAARLQSLNETSTSYIEDVLALCRRVDKDMTEADRVRHVMKGISEEAFNVLLVHNPTTVKDITTHCQRLYEARNSRLQVFGLHGSSSGTMPSLSTDGLRNMIQKIVREEISNLLRPSSLPTTIGNDTCIRRMIQQELATTMAPSNSNTSITDPPTLPANPLQSDIFPSIIGAPTLAPLCTTFARDNFPHWRTAAPHEHVAPCATIAASLATLHDFAEKHAKILKPGTIITPGSAATHASTTEETAEIANGIHPRRTFTAARQAFGAVLPLLTRGRHHLCSPAAVQ
ncbi:unnamed protein product, partial [Ixodes hexagonus]